LLVVTTIIALLAAVGLPALKGFGRSNAIATADRQLLNDLGYARQRAIAEHTDVYVLFMFPTNVQLFTRWFTLPNRNELSPAGRRQMTNLLQQQYTGYALFVKRSVGDQPGRGSPRYLTPWRSLPDGVFIAPGKYGRDTFVDGVSSFESERFPFPSATNRPIPMPYLVFNHLGQVIDPRDNNRSEEIIPLARGSIFYDADLNADLLENPTGNSRTNSTMFNRIRIDGLTGRARVEKFEMP
jgi:hypothetical protein